MMSDHWKSIAKFLGTPGLPDEPAAEEVTPPAVDVKPAATEPVGAKEDQKPKSGADEIRWEREPVKDDKQAAAILGERTPKAEPLPGFGSDSKDSGGNNWDELVDSFGIAPAEDPTPPAAEARKENPPAAPTRRSSRPSRRPEPSQGFGSGLGVEQESPSVDAQETIETPKAEKPEPEEDDIFAGFGKPAAPEQPARRRDRDSEPRGRRGGSRNRDDDRGGRDSEPQNRGEEPTARARGEDRPRTRGGRGRRGARRDAAPRDDAPQETRSDEVRTARPERSERPKRSERPERSESRQPEASRPNDGGRKRKEAPAKRERSSAADDLLNFSSFNDLPDDVDDIDLVDDAELVSDDMEPKALASDGADNEGGEEEEPRRRRRGRRGGRRRGRGGNSAEAEAGDSTDSSEAADPLPEVAAEAAEPRVSEFDDDHEDADEVVALRRGNRRRRGRRGRGGSGDSRESGSRDETTVRDDAGDREPSQPEPEVRQAKRRSEPVADDSDEDIKPRQRDIPSWIETVDLLVQPNINARGKRSAPRSRSGGRGRRRDSE